VNGVLTLTVACCLGWISNFRSVYKRARAWVAMTFFGMAIVLLLNTNVDYWSIADWIAGLCAAVVLYGAGVTAAMFVERLLQQKT
jgi:hypothetical protein